MPIPQAFKDRLFDTLIEHSPVAMALFYGPHFVITLANQSVLQYWGRTYQQVINKPLFEALPEAQGQGYEELLSGVYTTGERFVAYELAVTLVRNGHLEETFIDFVYEPFYEADSTIGGVTVVCTEITQQRLDRRKIEESEIRFRSLIEESPIATALFVGWELLITVANDTILHYLGKDRSIIGKPYREAVPELSEQLFFDMLNDVYITGKPFEEKEARLDLHSDGVLSTRYFHYTYTPLQDTKDQVYAIMMTAVEVTGEVVAKQALQDRELHLRNIILKSPAAMCLYTGPQHVVEIANERMIEFWGRPADELLHKPIFSGLPEARHQDYGELLDRVYTSGEPFSAQSIPVILPRAGELETIYVNLLYEPIREADGHISGVVAVAVEVTAQEQARQQVERSEVRYRNLATELDERVQVRTHELSVINEEYVIANEDLVFANGELASANQSLSRSNQNLEQFAFVASHDLQEPLRKVQQFSSILQTQYGEALGVPGRHLLDRLALAGSSMSILIKDLLSYSRISTRQAPILPISLNQVVSQVLETLSEVILESNAQINVDALPIVQGDSSQLEHLFQNLLSNALKFRRSDESGGLVIPQIRISFEEVDSADLPVGIHPTRSAPVYDQIMVSDNGIGFDEKYLDRIFEVFQRLHGKSEFAGTGIGLAICEKVVANHGGAITASSQLGQGSIFSVYFPTQVDES